MDDIEKRLKQDAARIEAGISPQFEERLSAALHSAGREVPQDKSRAATGGLWWASSLTGLAAAAVVIALLNWNFEDLPLEAPATTAGITVPDYRQQMGPQMRQQMDEYMGQLQDRLPLNVQTADFAHGLEEELARLQADLEKARKNVSQDIDFTF